MTLRLYWSPDSANLVVRIVMEVLGLTYETVRVNRGEGDHQRPEFLAKNPQGLLPVLEDGELVLFETGAILWHLVERAGRLGVDDPGSFDSSARATALRWIFYLSNTIHADLRVAFYTHRWVAEDRVEELRKGVRQRCDAHLNLMERQIEQGGLLGKQVTVPDIYLCVCMRWMQIYPPGDEMLRNLERTPGLAALAGRVEALPGAQRAFDAEFITKEGALTASKPPNLPASEVTGTL